MASNAPDLRNWVYAESEIEAYTAIPASVKTDNFQYPQKEPSKDSIDTVDTHSVVSYATSVYTDVTSEDGKKQKKKTFRPQPSNKRISSKHHNKHSTQSTLTSQFSHVSDGLDRQDTIPAFHPRVSSKDSFGKQVAKDKRASNLYKMPNFNDYGGGLARKLQQPQGKIRESMEMDMHSSLRSHGSSAADSARLSQIAKQSVITLRMIASTSGKNQIRVKLFLPLSSDEDCDRQIIVLFVNKGSTMGICRSFIEDNYPHGMLKGKIQQLCIADEDGDIDDDFPPINDDQDITSLGVQNFWIDIRFEDKHKPSIIMESSASARSTSNDKHKDTMKERLISQDDDESEEDDDEEANRRCCWCCCSRTRAHDHEFEDEIEDEEDEDDVELTHYSQDLVVQNGQQKADYAPPMNKADSDKSSRKSNVQYASL